MAAFMWLRPFLRSPVKLGCRIYTEIGRAARRVPGLFLHLCPNKCLFQVVKEACTHPTNTSPSHVLSYRCEKRYRKVNVT